jgi:uncharacterized protein (TIGR00661 family)
VKYLFIVQGEGRGHMTQAVTLQNLLLKNGHEICVVLVGKSPRRVIPQFFHDNIKTQVLTYNSPNFLVDKKGKGIRIFPTITYNLRHAFKFFKSIGFIRKQVKKHKPDIIINFYELLGGLFYLIFSPRPTHICIGHQFLVFHKDFEFPPGHQTDLFLFKLNTRFASFRAHHRLALSFRKMDDIPRKKIYVVPPLLRKEVLDMKPGKKDYILAYILNDGYRSEISNWQKKYPDTVIHFFSDGRQDIEQEEIQPNLFWHRIDAEKFMQYMKDCAAFASTAGFESICEAMYLGKPVLMVPTGGHFEQQCNAIDAKKAGAGISGDTFNLSGLVNLISQKHTIPESYKIWVLQSNTKILHYVTSK